jgi:altronate hydrolase
MRNVLRIDDSDNLLVALKDLNDGETVRWNGLEVRLRTDVRAKHKFAAEDVPQGGIVSLYGTPVGKSVRDIAKGEAVTVENIRHYAAPVGEYVPGGQAWDRPDVSAWEGGTFKGYLREDGRVGTANYWLVMPLVFCENRNAQRLAHAMGNALGYADTALDDFARELAGAGTCGGAARPFPRVDGIRPLLVTGGCGGAASDSEALCRLMAAYADHPNVGGITVFSLGCEKAQAADFRKALAERNPHFSKPALYYRQQDWDSESGMMRQALRETFERLPAVNACRRTDVPLSKLKIGVKCGGSDGFSGISANPAIGLAADFTVALGGAVCLAEFPELCGVEGAIVRRCVTRELGERFLELMRRYEKTANFFGTTIADNPSWGNIRDGLITDAMKSAGAAKKGGSAPVSAVLDYTEAMPEQGLCLTCTPGNDVLAVTGQVAAGCNLVLFSTGLGTPVGNPIVPVLKIAANSKTARRLGDMIDFDCGPIIEGAPLRQTAEVLFETAVACAGGDYTVKANRLEQYDFMLWKRSVDL